MTEHSVTLEITGMHCAACAQTIEKALRRTPGVIEANVNFAVETARVTFDPTQTGIKRLIAVVQDTGYSGETAGEQPQDEQEEARAAELRRQGQLFALGVVVSVPLFILSAWFEFSGRLHVLFAMGTLVQIICHGLVGCLSVQRLCHIFGPGPVACLLRHGRCHPHTHHSRTLPGGPGQGAHLRGNPQTDATGPD